MSSTLHSDPPTERQLEEGLAPEEGTTTLNEKTGVEKKHHHHHPHLHAVGHGHHRRKYRERLQRKRKQKVEAKLPGIMQGADNLDQARRRLTVKNEIVAAVGEFVGTFLFLFFSFGIATIAGQQNLTANSTQQVQDTGAQSQATSLDASQLLYSSLGFGFSLATNAWCFFRISGGLFNPAVALALFLVGSLTWYRFIILVIVEFLGALSAAGMANVLVPGGINVRAKIAGSTSVGQGFAIEMFMTAMLVFAVFMLAGEKHRGTFLAPVGIGLALFIAELWATPFTGGALNPVRALAPDVVAHAFEPTTWIYYTAPFVGALIATVIYKGLKLFKYESAVEGQDDDAIALVMKDSRGQVTGFVDQVPANQAPDIVKNASSLPPSPTASVANLALPSAGTDGAEHGLEHELDAAAAAGAGPSAAEPHAGVHAVDHAAAPPLVDVGAVGDLEKQA